MAEQKFLFTVISMILIGVLLSTGCSDGIYTGDKPDNEPPEVWLSSGPVENDTTSYQVHFYWSGWDPDGEISYFEFVVTDGAPIGFSIEDTLGLEKWTRTTAYDSVFRVSADSWPHPYLPNPLYTIYDQTHTFFLRAVDLEGKRSEAATLSFTAWTLAPLVEIERPEGSSRTYSNVITFGWTGRDPIDSPTNNQTPDSIRYMYSLVVDHDGIYKPSFQIIDDMNDNPELYEDLWSPWIYYNAPGDSGKSTILGDDEILEENSSHIFAVQAKDEAGAVTSLFRKDHNVRQFTVSWKAVPLLTVKEQYLGGYQFLGTTLNPELVRIPPGIALNFSWTADASSYGGEIVGYRYGWDISDLNDPADWDVNYSPYHKTAPPRMLYSGTHTLYIEVIDNGGKITRGRIEVEIVPFSMERNLLWVDDFLLEDEYNENRMVPTESEHDEFWLDICSMADGFEVERDVYDCSDYNFRSPNMDVVGKYKNIIWTYSSSTDYTTLGQVIEFVPESLLGQSATIAINYLSIYLTKGGHIWMSGRSDRAAGGLSLIFPQPPDFPASFKFDMTENEEDTSGVYCMGHKDLCVSVVDKVIGSFKSGAGIPARSYTRDALRLIYRDQSDSIAAGYTNMPEEINLWDEVTCPDCFFNPQIRGFTYVEMYNSEYWMELKSITPLACFHPLYRMRTRTTTSYVDYTTVGIVISKYNKKVPVVDSGLAVAANSFHFGIPLWFFDHESVNAVATSILDEWGLLSQQDP